MMKLTRLYATPDGGSSFDDLEVPFSEPYEDEFGNTYHLSRPFASTGCVAEVPPGMVQEWHAPPNRQIVVVLSGRLEVETGDGQTRQWGPGVMVLAEDCRGRGHRTRVIEGPAKLLFLQVAEDFDPLEWTAPTLGEKP